MNNRKQELPIIKSDVNARSQSCWSNDINTADGSKWLALSFSNAFYELINEP